MMLELGQPVLPKCQDVECSRALWSWRETHRLPAAGGGGGGGGAAPLGLRMTCQIS